MSRFFSAAAWIALPIIAGAAAITITAVIRSTPEGDGARRLIREAREVIERLPTRAEQVIQEAQERLARAKEVYQTARIESERALTAQLQEAKQRGSLPPLT